MNDTIAVEASSQDQLVSNAISQIMGIADGNGISEDAISARGSRADRPTSLLLTVDLAWKSESVQDYGANNPQSSRLCSGPDEVGSQLRFKCEEMIADSNTAEIVARDIRAKPIELYKSLSDNFRVGDLQDRCHYHAGCQRCGTKGTHKCTNLMCGGSGTILCTCGDGKLICTSNCTYGTVYYQDAVWDQVSQSTHYVSRQRTCMTCSGSGRSGVCGTCNGAARITCRTCDGDGWVYCANCKATGWFTITSTAWIVGQPDRSVSFPEDTPAGFMHSVLALPARQIPGTHADPTFKFARVEDRRVFSVFDCAFPHAGISVQFGNIFNQDFDAVGKVPTITRMPEFLDRLLNETVREISAAVAAGDMVKAVRLAQSTRATADVLRNVGQTKGGSSDGVAATYKKAVSVPVLERVFEDMAKAYTGLGRSAVRRTWLFGGPVVIAAAALTSLLGASQAAVAAIPNLAAFLPVNPLQTEVAVNLALGLAPTLIVWALAGSSARRAVRAVVGDHAQRRPNQGWWLGGSLALSVGAGLGAAAVTSMPGALPQSIASRMPGEITPVLSPAQLPELRVQPAPSPSEIRGAPGAYKLQFILAQLGMFHGRPDGEAGESTRTAAEAFLKTVPKEVLAQFKGKSVSDTAEAALRGDFRMMLLPANESLALGMSNVVRANLTHEDVARMARAADAALADPGREVTWDSAAGGRGGRVRASAAIGNGCAYYDVEVHLNGAAERTGPRPLCRSGDRWRPGA